MEKKYYKHKIENLIVISKIVAVGYFDFDKNFVGKSETHDFWEMVYADSSDVLCIASENEISLKEGEALFHKPGESHHLRSDGKHAPNIFVIMFECRSEAARFFENKKVKIDRKERNLIYSIIDESKRTFETAASDPYKKKLELLPSPALGGRQLIKNYLEILLIDLIRGENEKESSSEIFLLRHEFNERVTESVIEYMKEHIDEKVTVDDICKALHYNKSYLFREFKNTVGRPMIAYFTELKIEKAKKLLRESYMSVSDISELLSFDNPNYFSKTFKRITGSTPTKYRNMRKEM
jgi:AraC-like DNA-binding protein